MKAGTFISWKEIEIEWRKAGKLKWWESLVHTSSDIGYITWKEFEKQWKKSGRLEVNDEVTGVTSAIDGITYCVRGA